METPQATDDLSAVDWIDTGNAAELTDADNQSVSNGTLEAPNVAAVPQYSPFRYPGGKSRLYPFISSWLETKGDAIRLLIEPFAGGAHVGLAAAIEDMAERVLLVELDEDVAAVWRTILSEDYNWLVTRIVSFEVTEDSVSHTFHNRSESIKQRAFKTILRNRVSRSGIIAPGSGTLDYGENGKGLLSRWYPDTLKDRITRISDKRGSIDFFEGDGLAVMRRFRESDEVVFFIDPPYPRSGRRLYKYSEVDPEEVFDVACSVTGDFLITYEDSAEIRSLVREHQLEVRQILMSTSHHRDKYELLISRDLAWLGE